MSRWLKSPRVKDLPRLRGSTAFAYFSMEEGATASFSLLKDPRVDTTQADLDEQFELLQQLTAKRSELRTHVDRIRQMKRQLNDLVEKLPKGVRTAVSSATSIRKKLEIIENALVDARRESPRDVLRHPAGPR